MEISGFDKEGYCRRVRCLRAFLDMNQTEFCKFLDIDYKKWNHYERGYPLSRETVFKLYEKVREITPWWIWFGDTRGLDLTTLERLHQLEREDRLRRKGLDTGKPLKAAVKRLKKQPNGRAATPARRSL